MGAGGRHSRKEVQVNVGVALWTATKPSRLARVHLFGACVCTPKMIEITGVLTATRRESSKPCKAHTCMLQASTTAPIKGRFAYGEHALPLRASQPKTSLG